jgi:hypothetical protein
VFYHEASGGKIVSRAVLIDIEPGRSFRILGLIGNPLIVGFVEIQHEQKLGRGAAKRLRAKLALPTAIPQPR